MTFLPPQIKICSGHAFTPSLERLGISAKTIRIMTSEELYDRLLTFAKRCQKLVKALPKTQYNYEYGSQLIRSSASPGANYIEATEGSSRKDFTHRLKICRKEVKESVHWLVLIESANEELAENKKETKLLTTEAQEFIRIFTSSILTSEKNGKFVK